MERHLCELCGFVLRVLVRGSSVEEGVTHKVPKNVC